MYFLKVDAINNSLTKRKKQNLKRRYTYFTLCIGSPFRVASNKRQLYCNIELVHLSTFAV